MSKNEVAKPKSQVLDNFGSFDDSVEGAEGDRQSGGLLTGTRLKFTNEARWEDLNGDDRTDQVLLATNVRRTEVKWGIESGTPPVEVRELQPGDKFRDMEALNLATPKSEWREDFNGNPVGPWQIQHVMEFADLQTMERFSWPTATIGGGICVRELVSRIVMKRQLHERQDIWPLVKLTHRFMQTAWKGRERPYLEILDWYWPNKNEGDKIEAAPPQPKSLPSALERVPEPTLKEELKDELAF
jgi:hypothetical protein